MMANELVEFIAKKIGFYGKRYNRGETFYAPEDFEASWAEKADEADFDPDSEVEDPGFLDRSIPDIVKDLPDLDNAALRQAIDAETAGKTRKSLIARMQDELANRAGKDDLLN